MWEDVTPLVLLFGLGVVPEVSQGTVACEARVAERLQETLEAAPCEWPTDRSHALISWSLFWNFNNIQSPTWFLLAMLLPHCSMLSTAAAAALTANVLLLMPACLLLLAVYGFLLRDHLPCSHWQALSHWFPVAIHPCCVCWADRYQGNNKSRLILMPNVS